MDSVLVSLCSHGGACERFVSILDFANFSPGLQRVEAGKGCC